MNLKVIVVMAVATLAIFGDASCELYELGGPVSCLTPANFSELVMVSGDVWFVVFYAPWSGHCKHFAPVFKSAAQFFEDRRQRLGESNKSVPIRFGAVDGYAHDELSMRFGPTGFPTIFLFGEDKTSPTRVEGPRTRRSLIDRALTEYRLLQEGKNLGMNSTEMSLEFGSLSDGLFDETVVLEVRNDSHLATLGLAKCCFPFSSVDEPDNEAERLEHPSQSLVLAVYSFLRGNQSENREFANAFNWLAKEGRVHADGERYELFAALDIDEGFWGYPKELGFKWRFGIPNPPIVVEFQVRTEAKCFTSPRVHDSWRSFIQLHPE